MQIMSQRRCRISQVGAGKLSCDWEGAGDEELFIWFFNFPYTSTS
jgi:hypothetical protein